MDHDKKFQARLEHAHQIAAKLVSLHGDLYLPIFSRLQSEVERHEHRIKLRAVADQVTFQAENTLK